MRSMVEGPRPQSISAAIRTIAAAASSIPSVNSFAVMRITVTTRVAADKALRPIAHVVPHRMS
jgi:hypothetical protein